jgi:hypothetical protein
MRWPPLGFAEIVIEDADVPTRFVAALKLQYQLPPDRTSELAVICTTSRMVGVGTGVGIGVKTAVVGDVKVSTSPVLPPEPMVTLLLPTVMYLAAILLDGSVSVLFIRISDVDLPTKLYDTSPGGVLTCISCMMNCTVLTGYVLNINAYFYI